jgi:hypothetical protein
MKRWQVCLYAAVVLLTLRTAYLVWESRNGQWP